MALSHDSVHSPIAQIKFVVLRVRAVGEADGRRYRVYSSYSWKRYAQAEEWAREYGISTGETFARQVKSPAEVGLRFPTQKPAESQPKVPQVIVLDYGRDQRVVGIFSSPSNAAYLKALLKGRPEILKILKGPYQVLDAARHPDDVPLMDAGADFLELPDPSERR